MLFTNLKFYLTFFTQLFYLLSDVRICMLVPGVVFPKVQKVNETEEKE